MPVMEHVLAKHETLVLEGDAGCGKSALLANFILTW